MRKAIFCIAAALLFLLGACGISFADPSLWSSYTYSGTSGDYLLDFTLHNNIPAGYQQKAYFWGVDLAHSASQGSPVGWGDGGSVFNPIGYGGTDRNYPSTWSTVYNSANSISSGDSLSGFTVTVDDIPSVIHYFAFSTGNDYYVSDAFFTGWNPGFEGTVQAPQKVVPEPISSALFLLGAGALGLRGLRRKKS